MVNAFDSSQVTKAGTIIRSGSVSTTVRVLTSSGISTWAISQNISKVSTLVFRAINSDRGTTARSRNSSWVISSAT